MSVPYWLQPTDPMASDAVFNIPILTSSPPGLNYQSDDMTDLWSRVSEGAEAVVTNVKDTVGGVYSGALDFVKNEVREISESAVGVADNALGMLSKYFVLILGGLVLLIYVAGKSGLITAVIKVVA